MRDHIQLQINGQDVQVNGRDAFLTLSDFLRFRRRLTGTKIVCSEGDCGSCSVLCGFPSASGLDYRPIDSCIRFVFQLDGAQIVTIEGLKDGDKLSSMQQAMIDCHGSQCGFCTPGFIVAMTALQQTATNNSVTEKELRYGLTGNLCRCTGYTPIIQAGLQSASSPRLDRRFATNGAAAGARGQTQSSTDAVEIVAHFNGQTHRVCCPATIAQAVNFLGSYPQAKVIAGATDLGVQFNKGQLAGTRVWLDLNRVTELELATVEDDCLVAGARATWTDVGIAIESRVPQFHDIVEVFGSPQIRHVGTLGGNIINASPIADSLPFLFVCDAQLKLTSAAGERAVNISDFYHGYKDFDLREAELLTRIICPLPPPHRRLRLYKISRRRDLDISTFTAAIWVELEGNTIADAGIAYGAVGPVVLRLTETETFLRGKPLSLDTMTAAGDVAVNEITPISDVRGSANYRLQLARNVLKKFYYQVEHEKTPA